jgi:hypothetical protein
MHTRWTEIFFSPFQIANLDSSVFSATTRLNSILLVHYSATEGFTEGEMGAFQQLFDMIDSPRAVHTDVKRDRTERIDNRFTAALENELASHSLPGLGSLGTLLDDGMGYRPCPVRKEDQKMAQKWPGKKPTFAGMVGPDGFEPPTKRL